MILWKVWKKQLLKLYNIHLETESVSGSVMSDSLLLWTVAHQAPLSMAFSRQEYWSGLPHPSPGDLPNPGIELEPPMSPALQADSLPLSHGESPLDFIYDI